jgi:hypothetical protein
MIQKTIFPFKLEITKNNLTARGGLALMAEFNHGIGLRELVDRYLPKPGSNRGFEPSVFVDTLILMLQGGGRSLEDVRELKYEEGLMKLIDNEKIPEPDSIGDWCRRMGNLQTGQKGLKGLGEVRDKLNHRMMKRDKTSVYTLDADATGIVAEKADAHYTYKGDKGGACQENCVYEENFALNICLSS